ncbi:MAG: hypothetical protein AB1779_10155 [Candidatus Thermoplasmatota archaeon]
MTYKHDKNGVIDIPFKLLITVIIMAFTITIAFSGLDHYSKISAENNLKAQIDRIVGIARSVDSSGNGTAQTLTDVKIEGTLMATVEYVIIGDKKTGANKSMIRYKISGLSKKSELVQDANGRDIVLTTEKDRELKLHTGTYNINFKKVVEGSGVNMKSYLIMTIV